eukprot:scaffold221857_cov28-Tisochrysis_lutea.AAC.1
MAKSKCAYDMLAAQVPLASTNTSWLRAWGEARSARGQSLCAHTPLGARSPLSALPALRLLCMCIPFCAVLAMLHAARISVQVGYTAVVNEGRTGVVHLKRCHASLSRHEVPSS